MDAILFPLLHPQTFVVSFSLDSILRRFESFYFSLFFELGSFCAQLVRLFVSWMFHYLFLSACFSLFYIFIFVANVAFNLALDLRAVIPTFIDVFRNFVSWFVRVFWAQIKERLKIL